MTTKTAFDALEEVAEAIEIGELEVSEWEEKFVNDLMYEDDFSSEQEKIIYRLHKRLGWRG